jgi:hypothetical protein
MIPCRYCHHAGLAAAAAPALAAAAAAAPASSLEQQQQQQIVTPAELNIAAMLPASVADQIRRAQVKQALLGQGNAAWAVGSACLALYSGDGQYYPATVKAVTDVGNFVVVFEGYGNEEEVRRTLEQQNSSRTHSLVLVCCLVLVCGGLGFARSCLLFTGRQPTVASNRSRLQVMCCAWRFLGASS